VKIVVKIKKAKTAKRIKIILEEGKKDLVRTPY
jgi:hypothetical protein